MNEAVLRSIVRQALTGRGSHVLVRDVVDGLDWRLAGERPGGAPQSMLEIVRHMEFWQEYSLRWLDGKPPAAPASAAESWPGPRAPKSEDDWLAAAGALVDGLERLVTCAETLDLAADRGPKTVLEVLQMIASHNSYHAGQIAQLRRMLEAWPPPGGGATW